MDKNSASREQRKQAYYAEAQPVFALYKGKDI